MGERFSKTMMEKKKKKKQNQKLFGDRGDTGCQWLAQQEGVARQQKMNESWIICWFWRDSGPIPTVTHCNTL